MLRTAKCCCQACSITVEGEPVANALCHCASCRRRTGSAFGWSVYFPDAGVVGRTGEMNVYRLAEPAAAERWFCARCGTTLFWKAEAFAGVTGVAGGCFVDEPLGAPTFSANGEGRRDWLYLPAALAV